MTSEADALREENAAVHEDLRRVTESYQRDYQRLGELEEALRRIATDAADPHLETVEIIRDIARSALSPTDSEEKPDDPYGGDISNTAFGT